MAQNKNHKKNSKKNNPYTLVIVILIVALLAALGISSLVPGRQIDDQNDIIGKYEMLEKIDNQACRYLDRRFTINGNFDLNVNAPENEPKLTYRCTIGEMAQAREIHGKFIDAYEFGASVFYFSSNEAAVKFAEDKLNPLRYWGVDEEGQKNNIPQTSRFTFIVSDERVPYFDSYTVKANAVLRVSLPCSDPDVKNGGVSCYAEADANLMRELKGINVL